MNIKNLMKILALSLTAILFAVPAKAQVTIGQNKAPDPSAVLDLRSNGNTGLLLPRLALASTSDATVLAGGVHVQGMFVYNTATAGDVTPGTYYDNGEKWVRIDGGAQWFYMPSFNLPVPATVPTTTTVDLYAEYKKQFMQSGNPEFVTSNAAITQVKTVYTSDQLDYVVTAYPTSCMTINSISSAGVMNYTINSTNVPEGSFINVIFIVK